MWFKNQARVDNPEPRIPNAYSGAWPSLLRSTISSLCRGPTSRPNLTTMSSSSTVPSLASPPTRGEAPCRARWYHVHLMHMEGLVHSSRAERELYANGAVMSSLAQYAEQLHHHVSSVAQYISPCSREVCPRLTCNMTAVCPRHSLQIAAGECLGGSASSSNCVWHLRGHRHRH